MAGRIFRPGGLSPDRSLSQPAALALGRRSGSRPSRNGGFHRWKWWKHGCFIRKKGQKWWFNYRKCWKNDGKMRISSMKIWAKNHYRALGMGEDFTVDGRYFDDLCAKMLRSMVHRIQSYGRLMPTFGVFVDGKWQTIFLFEQKSILLEFRWTPCFGNSTGGSWWFGKTADIALQVLFLVLGSSDFLEVQKRSNLNVSVFHIP